MTDQEQRIHTIKPGDPVGDYFGFPETQQQILEDEADRGVRWVAGVEVEYCPTDLCLGGED